VASVAVPAGPIRRFIVYGLLIGLVVLVVVIVALVVAGSRSSQGIERVVRCRAGHLFTSTVIPMASVKAVRLGAYRFQRCPVGRHWTLVRAVDPASLNADELARARSIHDVRVP
jgi:hypothetical protein